MHRRTAAIVFAFGLAACSESPGTGTASESPTGVTGPNAERAYETAHFALDMGGDAGPNTSPVAADDAVTVDEDDTATIEVLDNDQDADGDELTVFISANASEGALTEAGGVFTYAPRANFNGTDSFSYGVLDGRGGSDEATVTITVTPVNDPPNFTSPTPPNFATITGSAGTAVEFQMAGTDIDDDSLTFGFEDFLVASDPPTVTDRTFEWTPTAEDVGLHDVTIFVSDGTDRDSRDITIEVAAGTMTNGGDCTDDDDCPQAERCFDGSCAESACDGVTCGDGESCFGGGCFAACATSADCVAGLGCFGGRCAEYSCADVTCAASERCFAGECGALCADEAECADGEECYVGTCRAADQAPCANVSCRADETCSLGDCTVCEGGDCGGGPRFEDGSGCGCGSSNGAARAGVLMLGVLLLAASRVTRRLR